MMRQARWMYQKSRSVLKGCGDSAITAHQRRFAGAVAPQYLEYRHGGQH